MNQHSICWFVSALAGFFLGCCPPDGAQHPPDAWPALAGNSLTQIIRPQSREPMEVELDRVLDVGVASIQVDALSFADWPSTVDSKAALASVLGNPELIVRSQPRWSMIVLVDLIGTINYVDGSTGRIAVAQDRVGFEDAHSRTWYFEWDDRAPGVRKQ